MGSNPTKHLIRVCGGTVDAPFLGNGYLAEKKTESPVPAVGNSGIILCSEGNTGKGSSQGDPSWPKTARHHSTECWGNVEGRESNCDRSVACPVERKRSKTAVTALYHGEFVVDKTLARGWNRGVRGSKAASEGL